MLICMEIGTIYTYANYTAYQKSPSFYCQYIRQILTDFQNSFASTLWGQLHYVTLLVYHHCIKNIIYNNIVCFCSQTPEMYLKLNII